MKEHRFEVGDRVIVYGSRFGAQARGIGTVKRVTKRFVELGNGSKWGLDGHEYPRMQYSQRRIEPATFELLIEVSEESRRRRAIEAIETGLARNFRDLKTHELEEFAHKVRVAKTESERASEKGAEA